MSLRILTCFLAFSAVGAAAPALAKPPAPAKSAPGKPAASKAEELPSAENVYGVIEIGSKGIKASAIQKLPDNPSAEVPPTKKLKDYEPVDKDAAKLESIKSGRVVPAVAELARRMEEDYHLQRSHLFLVGSSGLAEENRRLLGTLTFAEGQMAFINPTQEATLVFKGIVPKHRLSQVVVLDIGSGNSKGAYLEKGSEFATYSIPLGTVTYADLVTAARGDATFAAAAETQRTAKLLPAVRSCTQLFPGLQNKRRAYLAGGTPWALATLLHPDQVGADAKGVRHDWVKLQASDIDTYLAKAKADTAALLKPSLDGVRPENREEAEKDIAKIGTIFTADQILAGAQILKAFADEMQFTKKDAIFFSRRALYAWPHGYLLEQLDAERKQK